MDIQQVAYTPATKHAAKAIAKLCNLELVSLHPGFSTGLIVENSVISLRLPSFTKDFFVDFNNSSKAFRLNHSTREAIVQACRIKHKAATILDLTAGFGGDGFILSQHGFAVTLLERNPIIYTLLADGLTRARSLGISVPELIYADAMTYLNEQAAYDVLYLDPMRSPGKQAASKKGIAVIQSLVNDNNTNMLLAKALQAKPRKVVLKLASKHEGQVIAPNYQLSGKNTTFNIYLP